MRLNLVLLSMVILMASCSSIDKKKPSTQESTLNDFDNVPFQKLQTVRVMLSFASKQVDQEKSREAVINELKKFGNVHTPTDTSIDKLLEAQAKPFAVLALDVKELETSTDEKRLPILCISSRMYEEGKLALNNKDVMSNVWERIKYIEISPEKNKTSLEVIATIKALLNEFSEKYQNANLEKIKPDFYVALLRK